MNSNTYQICSRCIMDTSDPGIEFDASGICNRCKDYLLEYNRCVIPASQRAASLESLVSRIRDEGRHKEYDCVIGVSGGVDSTYVAYLVKKLGLRALAVHLDNGWDSELAVSNIEKFLKVLGIDLYTQVLDWDEFCDLQLAFLKASTPDSEIPTDHAILALMMKKCAEIGVRYVLTGTNIVTEGLFAPTWSMGHYDWKYIRSVHRQFGTVPLRTFPHFTLSELLWSRHVRKQQSISILNYIEYDKAKAMQVIQDELGWRSYGGKHHESIYTRFFQSYILPRKFGFDKRRMHLSTLVMSGQITRAQALEEMTKEICSPGLLRDDKIYVCKKFGLTEQEFEAILVLPKKTFWDYPSYENSMLMRSYRRHQRKMKQRRFAMQPGNEAAVAIGAGR